MMDEKTQLFLSALWRGGKHANYCTFGTENRVSWTPASSPKNPPAAWKDVYMCVHPRREILPGGARGGNDDVALINCLFADFDTKDGWTLDQVEAIQPPASVIISSGGGWHAYWLLSETVFITEANDEN